MTCSPHPAASAEDAGFLLGEEGRKGIGKYVKLFTSVETGYPIW